MNIFSFFSGAGFLDLGFELEGHFDIVIDATGCSVAVIYDVTIDFSQMNLSDSIKFTKLTTVKDGTESATGIRSGESTYTGIISLEDIKSEKTTTLRIYVSWEDDGTGKNDEADSLIGTNKDSEVTIPVTVKASQYMGESIAEYKP